MEGATKYVIMSLSTIIIMLMIVGFLTIRSPNIYKTEAVLELVQSLFGDDYIGEFMELARNLPNKITEADNNLVKNLNLGIFNILKPILSIIVGALTTLDFVKDLVVLALRMLWNPLLILWNWLALDKNTTADIIIKSMLCC